MKYLVRVNYSEYVFTDPAEAMAFAIVAKRHYSGEQFSERRKPAEVVIILISEDK